MTNYCVCCGEEIPEGRQVCYCCDLKWNYRCKYWWEKDFYKKWEMIKIFTFDKTFAVDFDDMGKEYGKPVPEDDLYEFAGKYLGNKDVFGDLTEEQIKVVAKEFSRIKLDFDIDAVQQLIYSLADNIRKMHEEEDHLINEREQAK